MAGENPYAIPTEKVNWKDSAKGNKPVEINQGDFDPKLHKKIEETKDAAKDDRGAKGVHGV